MPKRLTSILISGLLLISCSSNTSPGTTELNQTLETALDTIQELSIQIESISELLSPDTTTIPPETTTTSTPPETTATTTTSTPPETTATTTTSTPPETTSEFPSTTTERGLIHFARGGDLFVMNASGTNVQQINIESAASNYWHLQPSLDGSQILYRDSAYNSEIEDYMAQIFVMDSNGENKRQITDTDDDKWYFTWSPNEDQVIYSDYNALITVDLEGSIIQTRPFPGDGSYFDISLSPDGTKVAVAYGPRDSNVENLYVLNIDGSNLTQLSNHMEDSGSEIYKPKWSPDGTKIAYICSFYNETREDSQICVVNADGTNTLELTDFDHSQYPDAPSWSPDGQYITYALETYLSDDSIYVEILIMNADGTNMRTTKQSGLPYRWSE